MLGLDLQQELDSSNDKEFNTQTGTYETKKNLKPKFNLIQWWKSPQKGFPGLIPELPYWYLVKLSELLEVLSFVVIWLDFILRVSDVYDGTWRVYQIMSKLSLNLINLLRVLLFIWALLLLVAPMIETESEIEPGENNIMRFDTIQQTVLSLIQLLDSEDWPNQLYEMTFVFEKRAAILIVALIYITWIFLTNFILARMFIAVAMEGFELYRGEKYQIQLNKFIKNIHGLKQREESYPISNWNPYRLLPPSPLPLSIPKLPNYLKLRLPTHLTESLIDGPKPQTEKFTPRDYYRSRFYNDHPNYSRTLFLFRPNNPIRRFCHYLNDPNFSFWKSLIKFKRDLRIIYHLVIWTAIVGSTIVGGLNAPWVRFEYFNTREGRGAVYWHLNTVFTSILLFEFL
ncbi:hypothetical protein CONCODRAFT_5025, partial [Conidiobolus coronatus NRRL 28638]